MDRRSEGSGVEAAARDPGATASAATGSVMDARLRDCDTAAAMERYREWAELMRAENQARRKAFQRESIIAWTTIGTLALASILIGALAGG